MIVVAFLVACTTPDRQPPGTTPAGAPPARPPTVGTTGVEPPPPVVTDETDPACVPEAVLSLNEVQPANDAVLVDEDGDSVDWLELYNPGPAPVDLAGFTLSDDPDEPRAWTFPSIGIDPGGFLVVYASGKDRPRFVASWETRIDRGHTWRYLEGTRPPPGDWSQPGFDDGAWGSGPSGFGRDDDDDATVLRAHTIYVRTTLELLPGELGALGGLVLHVDYDDAFVAYLNGVEVARAGIGVPLAPVGWNDLAYEEHEGALYQQGRPVRFDLGADLGLLVEGPNVLAIEVHDYSLESSDLTLVPLLSLGFSSPRPTTPSPLVDLPPGRPHTNFSLKSGGEAVRLFDRAGCPIDELEPDHQTWDDFSYGRRPDGSGAPGWFAEPTPEASNTTEWREGFAETPGFDPPPGFYPEGVTVTVTSDPASDVRYAWDGWEPVEDDDSVIGPLVLGADREARVLRARAFQDGRWPSRIATSTWLFREPSDLPVVSVVTDPPNLWDEETGIYVYGLPDYDPVWPYHGANFFEDWERPVNLAMWEPDGSSAFAVDAGVSIHGGRSRTHEQKNLVVEMRSVYGDDAIEHEVFPGLGITTFDDLLLRAAGQDWLGCGPEGCSGGAELRDALVHEIAREEVDVQAYRPAEAYLNGEYWGLYDLRERQDGSYLASHHGVEDVDLLEVRGEAKEGDIAEYSRMMGWLRSNDLGHPSAYAQIEALVDLDEYLPYVAYQVYFDNTDWPGNNIRYWRPRVPDGRWRWLLYDADFGLGAWHGDPDVDTLSAALDPAHVGWPNPPWATELFRLLMSNPEVRVRFVNTYADLLGTNLAPDHTRAVLGQLAGVLRPHIGRHSERWAHWTDGQVVHDIDGEWVWEGEVAWIDQWLSDRSAFARQHVVSDLGLGGTWTLELRADPPGSGTIALTAVVVEPPFTGTYFRGAPVTVTAIPAPGYTFDGWSDPRLPPSPTATLPDEGLEAPLTARFR